MSRPTTNQFPMLLRKVRKDRGLTLGAVAEHLGTTVSYVAGVEAGRNPALSDENIEKVATLMGMDPGLLHAAKAHDRGEFRVPVPKGKLAEQLVMQFARGDKRWTDEEFVAELARQGFRRNQDDAE